MNNSDSNIDNKMPTLFLGHGSPMNAIEDNDFTRALQILGQNLPRPRAILMISAHWETQGTWITGMEKPKWIREINPSFMQIRNYHYGAFFKFDWENRIKLGSILGIG